MIRNAIIDDILNIINICEQHKSLKNPSNNIDIVTDYYNWIKVNIEKNDMLLVYEKDNNIIGFAMAEEMKISNCAMLWMIGIDKKYINSGIGVKLYIEIEKICYNKKLDWIVTYGYANNEKIHKMLIKGNFEMNGNIFNEYVKLLNNDYLYHSL
jgi:ribosomal protein S18 acetylase RimI-like enzyme